MHSSMVKFAFAVLGIFVVGCGGANGSQKLVQITSREWECPAEQINVQSLKGDTYRVSGCDHEAAFSCHDRPNGGSVDCTRVSGF